MTEKPWTKEETETALRFYVGIFLLFTIAAIIAGIVGYHDPYPSFQNYLKELPPGFATKFTPITYEFYFHDSYLVQVFLGIPAAGLEAYIMLKPTRFFESLGRVLTKLGFETL